MAVVDCDEGGSSVGEAEFVGVAFEATVGEDSVPDFVGRIHLLDLN